MFVYRSSISYRMQEVRSRDYNFFYCPDYSLCAVDDYDELQGSTTGRVYTDLFVIALSLRAVADTK